MPPAVKPPFEFPLPCATQVSSSRKQDVAQNRPAPSAQPDARTPVQAANSFAGLSVHGDVENGAAGLQMGLRLPELSGLETLLDSGM